MKQNKMHKLKLGHVEQKRMHVLRGKELKSRVNEDTLVLPKSNS